MSRDARKSVTAAYKERKPEAGVFTLLHPASGALWVGATATLGTIENRLRFERSQGGRLPKDLQALWTQEEGIRFEVVERIDPERAPFLTAADYRAMAADWAGRLGARTLQP